MTRTIRESVEGDTMPSIHDRDTTARDALKARKDFLEWRDNTSASGNRQRVESITKRESSHDTKPLSKSRRRHLRKQAKRQQARQAQYQAMRTAYAESLPDKLQDQAKRLNRPLDTDGSSYRKARLRAKRTGF